ncbi:hypothetical protein [uncultured Caballeronia sp.]|uniref:hypothetical protein n=1 Tax=uncultured Caballeronia sp. TaxID=1827198 RepID=UPI0035CB0D0A
MSISLSVLIFLCVLIASERQAFGYVDPGQGLIALQSLASVAAAFGYFMRRRIRLLFRSGDVTKSAAPDVAKDNNSADVA